MKHVKEHLKNLPVWAKAKLERDGFVCRWAGLTDIEGEERCHLIDRKYSGNATEEENVRLSDLQGRVEAAMVTGSP